MEIIEGPYSYERRGSFYYIYHESGYKYSNKAYSYSNVIVEVNKLNLKSKDDSTRNNESV